MSALTGDELAVARVRVLLPIAFALGLVLLWGCAVGSSYGIHVCQHYTQFVGGRNPRLDDWCNGRSWHGWLSGCLLGSAAAFVAASICALRTGRAVWLIPGTLPAGVGVWLGFAWPQIAAGPNVVDPSATGPAAVRPLVGLAPRLRPKVIDGSKRHYGGHPGASERDTDEVMEPIAADGIERGRAVVWGHLVSIRR